MGFDSVVCVCNATYCDALPAVRPAPRGKLLAYLSTRAGLRFHNEELAFSPADDTVHRKK